MLPLRDNDGRDLSAEVAEVEDHVYVSFGAWTQEGYYKGAWRLRATGERQIDTSAVYFVIISEDRLPELEAILRRFKSKTKQDAIYLEIERHVEVRFL